MATFEAISTLPNSMMMHLSARSIGLLLVVALHAAVLWGLMQYRLIAAPQRASYGLAFGLGAALVLIVLGGRRVLLAF